MGTGKMYATKPLVKTNVTYVIVSWEMMAGSEGSSCTEASPSDLGEPEVCTCLLPASHLVLLPVPSALGGMMSVGRVT